MDCEIHQCAVQANALTLAPLSDKSITTVQTTEVTQLKLTNA